MKEAKSLPPELDIILKEWWKREYDLVMELQGEGNHTPEELEALVYKDVWLFMIDLMGERWHKQMQILTNKNNDENDTV